MKKIVIFMALLIFGSLSANAAVMNYKTAAAQNGSKPMAVLIYADWAENANTILSRFKKVEQKLSKSYNFVELNIAQEEAKAFNENYVINTKMPYILLLRTNGRFSMIINRDCASSSKCISDKMRTFAR